MSTDAKIDMRRITETDKGYHVRFYSPVKEAMWFPASNGKEKALGEAMRYRNRRERELGLSKKDYGSRRPRARHANSKADTGVFPSIGYKNNRFYADVLGVLNFTDDDGKSKRKQKAISILKHGYHAAYIQALEARCKMSGLPKPAEVKVPKLTTEQTALLIQHGATKKLLTEKAVVPWTGLKA